MNSPSSEATLADWLEWLQTLSPRDMDLGLERVACVLERLALPRPSRVIHVAGTNGKGSSAALLEALYRTAGHRVGCYTSPHLLRFNERFRVDGCELPDAAILDALAAVEAVRDGLPLTFFEYTTAAALVAFASAGADVLVLEIGLGGRLDAVNAVEPDAALITNIGLDHCDWLGNTIDEIAREKAGVMRAAKPVVFASAAMPGAIAEAATATNALLHRAGAEFSYRHLAEGWEWRMHDTVIANLAPLPLRGAFQYDNAAGVLATYACIEGSGALTAGFINTAFADVTVAGRLQEFGERWLLDVAHNPMAAGELARELRRRYPAGGITAVIGALRDKDIDGILAPLLPLIDRWVCVAPDNPRALPAAAFAAQLASVANKPCYVADDIAAALIIAERIADPDHPLLVTGSFFVVGPALGCLSGPTE